MHPTMSPPNLATLRGNDVYPRKARTSCPVNVGRTVDMRANQQPERKSVGKTQQMTAHLWAIFCPTSGAGWFVSLFVGLIVIPMMVAQVIGRTTDKSPGGR